MRDTRKGVFGRGAAITSGVLLGLCAANAFAADGTLKLEQGLQWSEQGGGVCFNGDVGGGEFGVYDFVNNNGSLTVLPQSAAAQVTTTVNGIPGFAFQTFCLEPVGPIDFNVTLHWTASTTVQLVNGGRRNLDPRTAYLFTKFCMNEAFSPAYAYASLGAGRSDSAADVQLAIWYTEGVSTFLGGNVGAYVAEANAAVAAGGSWHAQWGGTFPGNLGGVRALYLVIPTLTGNLSRQQDILVVVPEGPPDEVCGDRFTGGGFLFETPTGARGNFAVGGGIHNGGFWGHLNYIDLDTGMHVKGKTVTAYTVTGTFSRRSEGTATIDGVAGTYVLEITDNGEPGRNDVLTLTLSNGYVVSGVIDGGNIQLHKPKCKQPKKKNNRK